MSILLFVPFFYIIAGCTYGTAAVIRRAYLSRQFSRLTVEEQNAWRDLAALRPLGGVRAASAIFSILLLLSALIAFLGFIGVETLAGYSLMDLGFAGVGDLAGYSLIGLVLLPPFVVGFQAAGVWRRKSAFLEEAGLRSGNGAMRFYYAVLIATWAVGVAGSYALGFYMLYTF